MRKESIDFLKKLLTTPSPSGFERKGQRVWLDYVKRYADETWTDVYGSGVATLNPGAETTVMIVGHADEIGLMVNYVDEKGFIYVQRIGGVDPAVVPGKRLTIHTAKGPVRGVTGATAIHLRERTGSEGDKVKEIHELFVDVGAKDKKAVEAMGIEVGDPITFIDDFELLDEHLAIARAFDNRIGTWVAAETLRLLKSTKKKLNCTVHATSCVQEEIGVRGAHMIVMQLHPDIALVTDVGHATDSPGIDARKHGEFKMGGGPQLSVGGPTLPEVNAQLKAVAKTHHIPLQLEATPGRSGTDADAVFKESGGVATGLVSLPIRYMHTTVEMTDLRDLERIARLFAEFCLSLKPGQKFRAKV